MKYWIFPWRETIFDLSQCLEDNKFVDWRQKNKLSVGDIVFIYATKPLSQIIYMFQVIKIDIPHSVTINSKYLKKREGDQFHPSKLYTRMIPITEADADNPELSYKRLTQLGIKSTLQNNILVEGEVLNHILLNFDIVRNISSNEYEEGESKRVPITSYERNPIARKECIKHYGYRCHICNMNFEKKYGKIGRNFIHVHHKEFISTKGGNNHKVDPIRDLIPVYPNCHAMLHRKIDGKYMSVDELKRSIKINNFGH
ncbi:MAG: hypothetical protein K2H44_06910 [Muribaculaceae bacterium]|nr:hypothetical protein [Muribaculaceae bacterium]